MFKGIIVAMLTPFQANGEVNYPALEEYIDFLIEKGVHGLFPVGTNGEGPALSLEEREKIAEVVVQRTAGRIPVIIHTGAINTRDTIRLTKHAYAVGANAAAVVSPYYFPHDEISLGSHFAVVCESSPDLPIFLYNIPGNAKNAIKPGLVKQLSSRFPNLVGIKDSSKDMTTLEDFIQVLGPGFNVVVGTDTLILPALVMGSVGVVSAVANVFPEPCVALYEAYVAGDYGKARELQYEVNRIRSILKDGPYISPYREALQKRGLSFSQVRSPFRSLTSEEQVKLERKLKEANLIL